VVQCALPAHDPAAAQGVSGHADGIGFNAAVEHRTQVEVLVPREAQRIDVIVTITGVGQGVDVGAQHDEAPGWRVIETKLHSNRHRSVTVRLTFRVIAYKDARTRVVDSSTSMECRVSIPPLPGRQVVHRLQVGDKIAVQPRPLARSAPPFPFQINLSVHLQFKAEPVTIDAMPYICQSRRYAAVSSQLGSNYARGDDECGGPAPMA
jgi:hypothetical protein